MILAIANNKGGILKTTSCVSLAGIAFQEDDARVLIVDSDNQGNAALSFGINPDDFQNTLYDALTGKQHPDDCIYRIAGGTPSGPCIDIMPSGDEMALFDFEILMDPARYDTRFELMRSMLTRVAVDYDLVLIDTPPNIGLTVGNVLTAADGVLVPFQPERYSMRSLTKILQAVEDFRAVQNGRLRFVGMFPVLVDPRTRLHRDIMKSARAYSKGGDFEPDFESDEEEEYSNKTKEIVDEAREAGQASNFTMFDTVITRSIRYASSITYKGQPLVMTDPADPISVAYRNLWEEIKAQEAAHEEVRIDQP